MQEEERQKKLVDNEKICDIIRKNKSNDEASAGQRPKASGGRWEPCGEASGAATSERGATSSTALPPLPGCYEVPCGGRIRVVPRKPSPLCGGAGFIFCLKGGHTG